MGRTLHEVLSIRKVRDHRTGGTVVALDPSDTGADRDPEMAARSVASRASRPSGQQHGSKQYRQGADADHDQDELKERRDVHIQHGGVCGTPPCRLSGALRTQFPAPFRGNNQISLSDNVVASGNARRSSSAVHKSATARGLRGVALSSGTIWRSVSGDPDQTSTTYRH